MVKTLIKNNQLLTKNDQLLIEIVGQSVPPEGEVSLTISGMTGSNWYGMGNGTHALNGNENGPTTFVHTWFYGSTVTATNFLRLRNTASNGSISYGKIVYNGGTSKIQYETPVITPTSSLHIIQDRIFGSGVVNGVTFTWTKGADWSPGNM